jgi:RNA polymerase sigma-70 factor, ECF subfamily
MIKSVDEDRQYVARTVAGDYRAFEDLVDKYQGRVYRHIRKMVNDSGQAEDILQETFLNAYRGMGDFAGASAFSTWLFRIATNNALMYLRKARPETVEFDDDIRNNHHSSLWAESPELVNTPLEKLLSMEGRKKIEEAIESLPVPYRSVLVLRDVEGFSLQEVAEIVDASVAAVKSRLHRARNAVKDKLQDYYADNELYASGAPS